VLWANGQTEDELVVRNGRHAAPRLKLLPLLPALQITNTVQHDQAACYSLTGGTGALGLVVAAFMATLGAGQLVLLSRSGRISKGKHWQQLQKADAEVAVCCSDVSVELSGTGQSVQGLVHAAGVEIYAGLSELSLQQSHTVLSPKVDGTVNLHCITASVPLDHFVLFSSSSALVGLKSGSVYAAANGYLDGFMGCQRAAGLVAQSVQWGAWTEIGMAAGIEANGYMTGGVTNTIGLCAMESLLSGWQKQGVFVADMMWQQFLQLYSHAPPLLAGFETKHQPTVTMN